MTKTQTTQDLIDAIDDYHGDNVWQDVIWTYPVDGDLSDDHRIVMLDGQQIRYNGLEWVRA